MRYFILRRGHWFWKRYDVSLGGTTRDKRIAARFDTAYKAGQAARDWVERYGDTGWVVEVVNYGTQN